MIRRPIVFSFCLLAWLLIAASPRTAAVAQSAGVTITGTVVDGSLTPLAGAVVTLARQRSVVSRTTSNGEGRFRFDNVAPGNYDVTATHAKAPALSRPLRIAAGVTAVNLPLVMAPPVTASEAVADSSVIARSASPAAGPPPPMASVLPPAGQSVVGAGRGGTGSVYSARASRQEPGYYPYPESRDRYDAIEPNRFKQTRQHPLSTFGADVDTAS